MILADVSPVADPITTLITGGGSLGIVVALVVKGWLVPGFVYKREVQRNDELEAFIRQQVAGTLAQATGALEKATEKAQGEARPRRRQGGTP